MTIALSLSLGHFPACQSYALKVKNLEYEAKISEYPFAVEREYTVANVLVNFRGAIYLPGGLHFGQQRTSTSIGSSGPHVGTGGHGNF